MKLQDICTSLELSKELKEAGFPQESLFSWVGTENLVDKIVFEIVTGKTTYEYISKDKTCTYDYGCGCCGGSEDIVEIYAAPTVAELGEALPANYKSYKTDGGEWEWDCESIDDKGYRRVSGGKTEANARAKMWLFLQKEGLL